jgi:hypothetical protein
MKEGIDEARKNASLLMLVTDANQLSFRMVVLRVRETHVENDVGIEFGDGGMSTISTTHYTSCIIIHNMSSYCT